MKKIIFPLIAIILLGACVGRDKPRKYDEEEKLTNSALCPTRKHEEKWAKQTPREMLESNNIPTIEFEFDSTVIKHKSYEILDKVAEVLTSDNRIKLIIEGYSDQVGSDEYNDWLSGARTSAVKNYLVSRGVISESIKTFGHGSRKLVTEVDTPVGRACNRRITMRFTTRPWRSVF
ncbi:MAG: OmpA family protein [Elusimicrobiaceae bacterium]|nr:OmpA family protein [Elusimicrobiaceae bacterium]